MNANEDRFLKLPEVENLVGLRRSAIYGLVSQARFPAPARLSGRASGWSLRECQAWINARLAERDAERTTAGDLT